MQFVLIGFGRTWRISRHRGGGGSEDANTRGTPEARASSPHNPQNARNNSRKSVSIRVAISDPMHPNVVRFGPRNAPAPLKQVCCEADFGGSRAVSDFGPHRFDITQARRVHNLSRLLLITNTLKPVRHGAYCTTQGLPKIRTPSTSIISSIRTWMPFFRK